MTISFRAAAVAAIFCSFSFVAAGKHGLALAADKPAIITPAVLQDIKAIRDSELPPPPAEPALVAPAQLDQDLTAAEPQDSAPAEAPRTFASLAAAVAAQPVPAQMDSELRCLAGAIYHEAKGEPLAGQLGVAKVVLNRTRSGRFPRSVCSVVTQRGQFSFVRGGEVPDPGMGVRAYRTAIAVAQVAMADHWESPVPGALYFHASSVAPGWGKQRVAAIGHHIFYR